MLTSATIGLASDTYASLTDAAAQGLTAGMIVQDPNLNRFRMLVHNGSGSTIGANAAVALSDADYNVAETGTSGQPVVGISDRVGGTVANGLYFWITVAGLAYPLVAASVSAGSIVMASGTAGTMAVATIVIPVTGQTPTVEPAVQTNISTLAASGTGGATACWIS